MAEPLLFTPFKMRDLTLPNRIALSPMGQHSAVEGVATDWHIMHLGQFAISGAGLVITEAVAVEPRARISRGDLGMWSDDQVEGMLRVRRFFDEHGADTRLGIQLNHCGRKGSVTKRWEKSIPVSVADGGWPIESASAIPYPGRQPTAMMSRDRLKELTASYANAARQSHRAGMDLIEIHMAHGYMLHTFLSPLSNQRDDEYGGSLENRLRFPLQVFEAVREAFPAGKPVGIRLSVTDWADGGWNPEESVVFARALKQRGCDFICASTGGLTPEQNIPVGPLYQVPFSDKIRKEAGIATIAVGLITEPEQAEQVLQEDKADIIALGRGLLREPRWPWHAARKLGGRTHFPPQYSGVFPGM